MKTKVVFFDAAGTLFHLPRGVGWHYAEVARRHGRELDPAKLNAAFKRAWVTMPQRETTRQPREDDDRAWWRELVHQVFMECGVTVDFDHHAYFLDLWDEFARPGVWELYPEVREVLASLRPQMRLGVISNFDGRLHPILASLGIAEFFEHVVISSEVGADKPDPFIFEQALGRFGLCAEEALHVGDDRKADWSGASALGMRVFELDRPGKSLSDLRMMMND